MHANLRKGAWMQFKGKLNLANYGGGVQGDDGRRQNTHSPRRRDNQWKMTKGVH
jgi:hypothetical protein